MPLCRYCFMPNESGASTCCFCGATLHSTTNVIPQTAVQAESKREQLISELEKLHADWKKARIEHNQVEQMNAQTKADKLRTELLELDDRFPPETNYKRQHLLCSYVPFPKKFYPEVYGQKETPQQTVPTQTAPEPRTSFPVSSTMPRSVPQNQNDRWARHHAVIERIAQDVAKNYVRSYFDYARSFGIENWRLSSYECIIRFAPTRIHGAGDYYYSSYGMGRMNPSDILSFANAFFPYFRNTVQSELDKGTANFSNVQRIYGTLYSVEKDDGSSYSCDDAKAKIHFFIKYQLKPQNLSRW